MSPRLALRTTSNLLNRATEHLLSALGLSMALVIGLQVFCRYVLNHSLFWSEELARAMLVWLTFLGAAVAWHRGLHPGVDVLARRLPTKMRCLARLLVQVAALAFFVTMIIGGWKYCWFVRHQISPALAIPRWIVPAVIPVSGLLLLIHTLAELLESPAGT